MEPIPVVGAVIVNENLEILCALKPEGTPRGGFWEFPGGKVESGESHQECLKREIQEELDCGIEVLHQVTEIDYSYEDVRILLSTYFAILQRGVPKPNEHQAILWKSLDALQSLPWAPADQFTVDWLLQNSSIARTFNDILDKQKPNGLEVPDTDLVRNER